MMLSIIGQDGCHYSHQLQYRLELGTVEHVQCLSVYRRQQ